MSRLGEYVDIDLAAPQAVAAGSWIDLQSLELEPLAALLFSGGAGTTVQIETRQSAGDAAQSAARVLVGPATNQNLWELIVTLRFVRANTTAFVGGQDAIARIIGRRAL